MEAVLIVGLIFGSIAAVIIAPFYFRNRERMAMQDTLRTAYQNGQPVSQDVIEALGKRVKQVPTPLADIRSGVIWLAIAGGLVGAGYMGSVQSDFTEPLEVMQAIAVVPGVIGLVVLALGIIGLVTNKATKTSV